MRIRIWAGQEPLANSRPGPTRLLENESCEWALSGRVSDAGRARAIEPVRGRRPKASDERTRGKAASA